MFDTKMTLKAAIGCVMALTAVSAYAVAPVAVLSDTEPGLDMPFDTNLTTTGDWGVYAGDADAPVWSAGTALQDGNDRLFYQTTNKLSSPTVTAMDATQDWVASFDFQHDGAGGSSSVFEFVGDGGDIARLAGVNATEFALQGGDGSGGYTQVGLLVAISEDVLHTLTLHYKAATETLDFYIDDDLSRADFIGRKDVTAGTGDTSKYTVNGVFLRGGSSSTRVDIYDNVRIGVVPEPASLALIAIGGTVILARRKR